MYMADDKRVKKKDAEIILLLVKDTKNGILDWYTEGDYYYSIYKIPGVKKSIVFKITDEVIEDEYTNKYAFEFPELFIENILVLEIYMRKDESLPIFCKRLATNQLHIVELLNTVLKVLKNKPNDK